MAGVRSGRSQSLNHALRSVERVVRTASGYPYFLQVYGKETWDFAETSPIDVDDARVGIEAGLSELDVGFYGSRWERATAAQRSYLRAVAAVSGGESASTADVARNLGRRPSDLSVARDQLIKKGLLFAPDRGTIEFTVPGMADDIARRGF